MMGCAWKSSARPATAVVYDQIFSLSSTTPKLINFNCVNVTNIQFIFLGRRGQFKLSVFRHAIRDG